MGQLSHPVGRTENLGESLRLLHSLVDLGAKSWIGAGKTTSLQQPGYLLLRRRNLTHTGVGTCVTWPVVWSFPVRGSMRNVTTVSVSWLAQRRNLPVGS